MEKIKSVLSGHKKSDDATHHVQVSSTPATRAHHDGEPHPIYDQMKGTSSAQPTATGATSAAQTGTTSGLGQTGLGGTDAPIGGHPPRPGAHMLEGVSDASIKSGVIGFGGSGEPQGHAALSSQNNPEANLDRNQIVGGGNMAPGPTTSDTSNQPGILKSALPLPGTSTTDQQHSSTGPLGSTTQSSTTHQPSEQTLRQESYTNETDRSFPLAGGVTSKHDSSSSHPTDHISRSHQATEHHTSSAVPLAQQTSSTSYPITSEREPGTKEKEVGVRDGHGREGLAGAAAAATAIGVAGPLSQSHPRGVHGQGLGTREATYGGQPSATSGTDPTSTTTQSHHPDALAAATAAAANSSTTHRQGVGAQDNTFANTSRALVTGSTSTAPADSRYTDPGRPPGGRKLSYRHVPGGFPSPTPDDAKTFLFYRDEVVPEPGVDGPVIYHAPSKRGIHGTHDDAHHSSESGSAAPIAAGVAGGVAGGVASSREPHYGDEVARDTSTAGRHQSDALNKLDPKVDSDLDGSRTTSGPTTSRPVVGHATNAPLTTGDAPGSGPHELRHTGSLEQPTSRAAEHADELHHGRDAALAGGVGVGVGAGPAGLGYAATNHKDTPTLAGEELSQESSPYSSKQLDPRALGSQAKLEEQRFDPQARSESGTHQTVKPVAPVGASSTSSEHYSDVSKEKSTTGPHKSSLLNKLDPRVKNDTATKHERSDATTKYDKHDDHHARDAALIGGGAATAAGVHHSLQRNETAEAGTAILPEEQTSRGSGAFSSTTTNQTAQTTSTSAPLSSATSYVPDQTSRTSAQQSVHPGDAPHPAATKKYEPCHGPMTTDGSPFYGTVGAPAPIEASRSSGTDTSTTVPVHGIQDAHTSSTLPATQQKDSQHQHGREAALVGAGTATAGGLYASQHNHKTEAGPAAASNTVGSTTTDPASKTIGPHESNVANVLDPRVQPDPSKQKGHTTTGPHQSDTLNRLEPKVDDKADHQDQHHFSRNAAIIGGTGAAGSGAHEAIDAHGNHRSIQPGASMDEQHYDTSASSARAPNPVPSAGHYDYKNDNTNRNVALGSGAALGAGGLYAVSKHGNETSQAPLASNQPLSSSSHAAPLASNQPLGSSAHTAPLASSQPLSSNATPLSQHSTQGSSAAASPAQGTVAPQNTHSGVAGTSHAPEGSVQEPYEKDHSTRDAAVLGTAGTAAVGGAAYAHNQQSDFERERARLNKEQHDREKEQQKLDKEHSKQEKEQHKQEKEQNKQEKEQHKQEKEQHKQEKEQHKQEKEQHKHDKAVLAAEKREHKHEREQEKEAHRLEKEREKEAHRLEKEREKETGTPEKKHGILGFLHRDKSKKEKTSSADNSPRQSGEARRSVDNSRHSREHDENNPDSPRWKGKNRLHKDPPKGHPAREALEHHELGAMDSGKREHVGTDGPIGDPNATSGVHQTRDNTYGAEALDSALQHNDNKVIEPHTGLPMMVGKYGDGHGGTDANPTVHGHHEHAGGVGGAGQQRTTGWEAVEKTDTPY